MIRLHPSAMMHTFRTLPLAAALLVLSLAHEADAQPFIPKRPAGVACSPLWTLYGNEGQIYRSNGDFASQVLHSTVGTNPAIHAMKDARTGFVFRTMDGNDPEEGNGTLAEVDMTFIGEGVRQPIVSCNHRRQNK